MLLIPIGDEPNPRTTPYATTLLVVANIAVWLFLCLPLTEQPLQWDSPGMPYYLRTMQEATGVDRLTLFRHATRYDLTVFRFGFRPAEPSIVALFASLFLHAGWTHLFGNVLILWIFGNNVEARLGPWRYLAAYLTCGVVATLVYAAWRPHSPLPLVGASGAISGVLGCYLVWFPRNRVRVLATLLIFWRRFTVPAWVVLSFYFIAENLLPWLYTIDPRATGVAHGAHVGGFVAGAALGLVFVGPWRTFVDPGSKRAATDAEHAFEVRRLLAAGAYEAAWEVFLRLPPPATAHVTPGEVALLVDWLTQQGNFPQAQAVLAEAEQTLGAGAPEALAEILLRRGLIAWRGQQDVAAARLLLQRAVTEGEGPGAKAAVDALAQLRWGG